MTGATIPSRTRDVVVIGAGPAGLAAAIRLRRQGLSVAVLDRAAGPRARIGESVPGELRAVLRTLGVWPAFCAGQHLPSAGRASAWVTSTLERSDAFCSALSGGWHLDRCRFEAMLRDEAVVAGADVHWATAAQRVEGTPGRGRRVNAIGREGRRLTFETRVVIDASGRAATVARWCGARRLIHDRLVCIYARFAGGRAAGAERRTLVEAVDEGWWYAAPLPGDTVLVAFYSDPMTVRRYHYTAVRDWHAALQRTSHVRDYAGAPGIPPTLEVTCVTPHCLDEAAGESWIAVGDAAASFDPLSSAGIALALHDGVWGADAVARHIAGDSSALGAHARRVQGRFARYLRERAGFYGLARRWPTSAFWAARAIGPTALGSPGRQREIESVTAQTERRRGNDA